MKRKKLLALLLSTVAVVSQFNLFSQSKNATIQVTANVQASPARVVLNWSTVTTGATSYLIYRKTPLATSWGSTVATIPATTLSYTDNTVSTGTLYEYKIVKQGGTTAYGYITSGINVAQTINRGRILVIVDNTFSTSLAPSITTYTNDLVGEGWVVRTSFVSRTAAPSSVKTTILNEYNLSPATTKAAVLIGHVPVPYSGDIAPDGHTGSCNCGEHRAAWPADCYYADMNGTWTDATVNFTLSSSSRNYNVPGDGKFDQSYIPGSTVELQIGRIDMANLPAFTTKTELQLLQDYFTRNHNYRNKITTYTTRALIDDNFNSYAESAWLLAPLVGSSNITSADYFTTMNTNSYLWSYGCGAGSYNSLSGVGTTGSFVTTPVKTVFTMLFGSWTGDWDSQDNFMRASLASGALTCVWSGRPNWFYHDMGMGETVGFSNQKVQNNVSGLYQPSGFGNGYVHASLLGDPTLRNDVIAPPTNLSLTFNNANSQIFSWTASPESGIAGYNIYKLRDNGSGFIKLNATPLTTTSYTTCIDTNDFIRVVVKAVKLITTPSGTYYNESTGPSVRWNNWLNTSFTVTTSGLNATIANGTWGYLNTFGYDYNYNWLYSDGTSSTLKNPPVKTFSTYGAKSVQMTMSKGCRTATATKTFTLVAGLKPGEATALDEIESGSVFAIYPNPSNGLFTVQSNEFAQSKFSYFITDYTGRLVKTGVFETQESAQTINIEDQTKGIYFVQIVSDNQHTHVFKIVKE